MQRLVDERALSDTIEVDSAGTGGWHIGDLPDRRMRVHARQRGYELTHHARQITLADIDEQDLIVCMDNGNVRDVQHMVATVEQQAKVVMLGNYIRQNHHYDYVPDPYYEGSEGFELVLDLLEDSCECLLNHIVEHQLTP